MNKAVNKRGKKLKYEKPVIRKIKLAHGDEILGVGCKTDSQTSPFATEVPCNYANCQLVGT